MIYSFLGHLVKPKKNQLQYWVSICQNEHIENTSPMVKVRAQSNFLLKGYGQKTSKNQLFPKITNLWRFFGHKLLMNNWIALIFLIISSIEELGSFPSVLQCSLI